MSAPQAVPTPFDDPREQLIAALELGLPALVRLLRSQQEADRAAMLAAGKKYYSPLQVAQMTSNSKRSITNWCVDGTIKAEKHGSRWRITAAEVERFLARSRRRGGLRAVEI